MGSIRLRLSKEVSAHLHTRDAHSFAANGRVLPRLMK